MSDEYQPYVSALPLPEGAVAQHSIMIVAYFTEDGMLRYGFRTQGETSTAGLLGLIEMVKFDLMARDDD